MRVKLDENIPARLVPILSQFGHDVETVVQEGLVGCPDEEVWRAAQRDQRFLITHDLDFSDMRAFTPGRHAGILLIRLRTPGRTAIVQRVQMLFAQEDVASWKGCFIVASDRKLRVRR